MNDQSQEPSPYFEVPPASVADDGDSTTSNQGARDPSKISAENDLVGQASAAQVLQQTTQQGVRQADSSAQTGQPAQQMADDNAFPQIADDDDLIEKEWVESAKRIVARTAHDPHLQNREISKIRADYMKKRYNKDINLIEDT